LIAQLGDPDWRRVSKAAAALRQLEDTAVPGLLAALANPRYVRLSSTADLIYPGVEQFYGHGASLNYDLDWTHIRAGWVLEGIAFRRFGFGRYRVADGRTGSMVEMMEAGPAGFPADAVASAGQWWAATGGTWRCSEALTAALSGADLDAQATALSRLRQPATACQSLTLTHYETTLSSLVRGVAEGESANAPLATRLQGEAATDYWKGKLRR